MATTTTITLTDFNLSQALAGAVLGFSDNGTSEGKLTDYVLNFQRQSENTYIGYVDSKPYRFNSTGGCYDGVLAHKLFIVLADIKETTGTSGSRAPGSGEGDTGIVDINSLQPREHFAIAALKGIMYHMTDPLALDDAAITMITTKAFRIAQGMMAAAADARAEYEKPEDPTEEGEKKDEIEINPDDLTSASDKILYNIYVQNNNRSIDDKSRFDKLTGAEYNAETKELQSVKGLKIYTDEENPLVAKLHEDSKIAEIGVVKSVSDIVKVSEVVKITNDVDVNIVNDVINTDTNITNEELDIHLTNEVINTNITNETLNTSTTIVNEVINTNITNESINTDTTIVNEVDVNITNDSIDTNTTIVNEVDVNITNPSIDTNSTIMNESLDVNVLNTVDANIASSSITVPVAGDVAVANTVNTYVTNMPTVPSEPVSITGTVSVNNFPSSE